MCRFQHQQEDNPTYGNRDQKFPHQRGLIQYVRVEKKSKNKNVNIQTRSLAQWNTDRMFYNFEVFLHVTMSLKLVTQT
jgi:hypothetical protein